MQLLQLKIRAKLEENRLEHLSKLVFFFQIMKSNES